MADEGEALFDEPELVEEQPIEEAPAETPEQPELEAEAPAVEPEPEPQPQRPDAGYVPIAAMMDERDKRRALEAQLAQFQRQQPQAAPNPFDDPEGFAAHQTQQVEARLTEQRFAMSDLFARQQHGDETVNEAVKWAETQASTNPVFASSYMQQQNPIGWIVQQHKRDALLGQIGDKPLDDFVRDYLAQNPDKFAPAPVAAAAPVVAQPQQAAPPVKVPRSLATQGSGPSDVRDVATGALAAVDAVFPQ